METTDLQCSDITGCRKKFWMAQPTIPSGGDFIESGEAFCSKHLSGRNWLFQQESAPASDTQDS